MLLFKKPFHAGLVSGAITLTYRRWQKPHVRVGGRYRCHPIGVLEVDRVELVRVDAITEADAARAGFASRAALVAYMAELGSLTAATEVYRVELHHGGDGDRVELALEDDLDAAAVEDLRARLARFDRETPWTATTLALIAARPQVAASKLAASIGRETLPFKVDVRKLKKLGLTQSFEVGYEVSPRGRAYLKAIGGGVKGSGSADRPTSPSSAGGSARRGVPRPSPGSGSGSGSGSKKKPAAKPPSKKPPAAKRKARAR